MKNIFIQEKSIRRLTFNPGLALTSFRTTRPRGRFLERPGNLTGPISYFEIKVSRRVGCVLTSNEVQFVSLADDFTVKFSELLKLSSGVETKHRNAPGNYRELGETGPSPVSRDPSIAVPRSRLTWLRFFHVIALAGPAQVISPSSH